MPIQSQPKPVGNGGTLLRAHFTGFITGGSGRTASRLLEKVTRQMLMFYVPYCGAMTLGLTRNLGDQHYTVLFLREPIVARSGAYSPAVDFMRGRKSFPARLRFHEPVIVP